MSKSLSAGSEQDVTSTLLGLMSRWMMPVRCAVSAALASLTAVPTVSATDIGAVWTRTPRSGGGQ
jgi:hypothetical protein